MLNPNRRRVTIHHAEIIFTNATILTMDPARPRANLLATRGGRIIFVGDMDSIEELRGPNTRLVDCDAGALLPGFHDAHLHLMALASRLVAADCTPELVDSIAKLQISLSNHAAQSRSGGWLRAWGYDEFSLAEKRHPIRSDLDLAVPNTPVILRHRSGHAASLNSLALRLLGITKTTPDPRTGMIERDQHGEPTGLLLDMEMWLEERIPKIDRNRLEDGMRRTDQLLLSKGITSTQDASPSNDLGRWNFFRQVKESGTLNSKVILMPGATFLEDFRLHGMRPGTGTGTLRLGHMKLTLTLSSGFLIPSLEELSRQILTAQNAGFPVALHAVEENAVEAAVDTLLNAQKHSGGTRFRHRIEHCSECPPALLEKLARSGAMVVTNPGFLYWSGERYLEQVHASQQPWLYRIRSLREMGIALAFGSDAPIELPDPATQLYGAVTRTASTRQKLSPRECVTITDALNLHTAGGAYASGLDTETGVLKEGMWADLVLLERDPVEAGEEELLNLKVRMTVLDGRIVWEE